MEIFSSHFLLCKVFDLTLSVGGNSGYFYLSDWWLAAWKFVLILDSKMLSLTGELTLLVQGGWVQAIVGLGLQWLRIPQLIKVHVGLSLSLSLYGPGTITMVLQWRKAPNIMMWCIPRKEPPGWARQARKKWASKRWRIHPGPNLEHCCQNFRMSKI